MAEQHPESWEVVPLGDFVISEKGKKPKSESESRTDTHFYPYIDIEAFEQGIIKSWADGERCRFCYEDDFLIVWDGSRSGLVGKAIPGALGSTLARVNFPGIHNPYAFYFLRSKYLEINNRARGTGTPHVDPELLWNYAFPIPPLNEQRRIVAKIEELFSELDAGVESLKTARLQLGVYRQALLKKAFEGKLTEKWRVANPDKLEPADALLARIRQEREARYQQQLADWKIAVSEWEKNLPASKSAQASSSKGRKPAKPRKPKPVEPLTQKELAELPELAEGWIWVSVEGLLIDRPSNGRSVKDRNGGFKVLRLTALRKGRIDLDEFKEGDWIGEQAEPFVIRKGDFLISRGNGSKKLVGRGGVVPRSEQIAYPDTMIRLPLDLGLLVPDCFSILWNSECFREQIEKTARTTAGIYKINQALICDYKLPLCSLPEQHEIVRILEEQFTAIEQNEREIDAALERAEALRQSILKKAFSGKLVPQDPNDEPASALLERIRTEREAAAKQKPKKKAAKKTSRKKRQPEQETLPL